MGVSAASVEFWDSVFVTGTGFWLTSSDEVTCCSFLLYSILSRRLESLGYLGIDVALNQLADLAPGTCAVERIGPACTIQNC